MSEKLQNIQDRILSSLVRSKQEVQIILTNGFQIRGRIQCFDNFVIVAEDARGTQNMIYKHVVSTVQPTVKVSLSDDKFSPTT